MELPAEMDTESNGTTHPTETGPAVTVRGWVAPDFYGNDPARFNRACEHGLSGRNCRGPAHFN